MILIHLRCNPEEKGMKEEEAAEFETVIPAPVLRNRAHEHWGGA